MTRQLSPYVKFFLPVALLIVATLLPSCKKGKEKRVPESGELMYEVVYSENLREVNTIGPFLPHSATGVFDSKNFKITTSAPLSFAKVSIVHGSGGDFMTITVDEIKFLADFSSFSDEADSETGLQVVTHDEVTEICGFKSRQTSLSLFDGEGDEFRVDIFSAIPNKADSDDDAADDETALPDPVKKGFGLVTALSIRYEESNIIYMLKSVLSQPVDPEEFVRPSGFIETSAKDFVVLMQLM